MRAVRPATAIRHARALRQSTTDAERRFWNLVRNRSFGGLKFVRQYPIGPFIADFACRDHWLVVEIDGGHHAESAPDQTRTALLNRAGYSVLRFWNSEVLNELPAVHDMLQAIVSGHRPSPGWRFSPATLSPEGRGDPTGRFSQ